MLEQTTDRLARLSPELRVIAEEMALATLASDLQEHFLPPAQASDIAAEHRAANSDTWGRAVIAAVSSLLALHGLGYSVHKIDPVGKTA